MPINIIDYSQANEGKKGKPLKGLCEGEWELPSQIDELEKWLIENEFKLSKGSYVADIGFNIRKDALGGGGVVTLRMMEIMLKIGMELFLSEYPDNDESED